MGKNNIFKQFLQKSKKTIKLAKQGSKQHTVIIAGIAFAIILIVTGCGWGVYTMTTNGGIKQPPIDELADQKYDKDEDALDVEQLGATILIETEDAGQEYIDETLFIGDSNTVRTMMYGYTTWDNVIAAVSMGVQHINTLKLAYFKGYSNPLTVPDAVKVIQPKRIVITYGTNNTIGYSTQTFIDKYKEGLDAIKKAYPYADIIINAIPPIDKQRENLAVTMQTIDKFNKALADMAQEEGYKFLNSAEVLKDSKTGFAKTDYTIGDGVHLNKNGMAALFDYITTHAYITEDKRPKPLNKVPAREETPTGIITQDPLAVRGAKVSVIFLPSDSELGYIDGEIEQKIKRTLSCDTVVATPKLENGGIFTGWSVNHGTISDTSNQTLKFVVPKVDDEITEIKITANFRKAQITIKQDSNVVSQIKLDLGASTTLTASVEEAFKGDKAITWASEDDKIATVDSQGKITAVSGGKVKIYASATNSGITASCEVTVVQPLSGISLTGTTNIQTGATSQLKLVLNPTGANADTNKAVWSSSDTSVATVTSSGLVTATNKEGTATITCTLEGKTAQAIITVLAPKPLESISLAGNTTVNEGQTTQITINFNPSNTTDSKDATWSSNNPAVATVNNGLVTGVSKGVATITCTVGKYTQSIDITVNQEPNYVSSVTISQTSLSVDMGGSFSLTATPQLAYPSRPEGVDITATWSSGSNGYITIDNAGNATVRGDLTSESGVLYDTITVTIGGKTAQCAITITNVTIPPIEPQPSAEPQPSSEPTDPVSGS